MTRRIHGSQRVASLYQSLPTGRSKEPISPSLLPGGLPGTSGARWSSGRFFVHPFPREAPKQAIHAIHASETTDGERTGLFS